MFDLIETTDRVLMNWLRAVDSPWLDPLMTWISASGGAGLIWLVLAAAAFVRPRDRAAAWRVLLTVALAYLLVDGVVKPLVSRPRPTFAAPPDSSVATVGKPAAVSDDVTVATTRNPDNEALASPSAIAPKRELPPMPRTYSFPSGHAASTFGAAVAVSRMWPHTRLIWWTLAALIGYSRIYLGHHYPLDVVGGAIFGVGIALSVLGGRHRATDARTVSYPLPDGVAIKP